MEYKTVKRAQEKQNLQKLGVRCLRQNVNINWKTLGVDNAGYI
jgi:hypothetical protein